MSGQGQGQGNGQGKTRIRGLVLAVTMTTALAFTACGQPPDATPEEPLTSVESDIVRGTLENGRNYVMAIRTEFTDGGSTFCSSALFAPRVLVTAAHCIAPKNSSGQQRVAARVLAYIGNNFDTDFAALGPNPYFAISAAPAPSRFMRADSWETIAGWNPDTVANDLAVVYLDRQPRLPPNTIVDPLPIGRTRLAASLAGQPITEIGYGALLALTADISQTQGGHIKRTGTAPFVGQPITSPLPPHPHPGLGIPAVLSSLFQTNGSTPNANTCAGDSGGPAVRNSGGQDQIVGISTWTGDFCESFSYYTRMDPFLPFLDQSFMKGGQAPLTPRTECVGTRPGGGLRAYFGYNNQNGVVVNVPLGTSNVFAQDTGNLRPTTFLPGNHQFRFGTNFTAGQTLSYRLIAPNGPNTLLTVNQSSPRCDVNSRPFICAQACDPGLALNCGDTEEDCVNLCVQSYDFFAGCETQFDALNRCTAQQPTSSFICSDFDTEAFEVSGVCNPQSAALNTCLGF
jgi:secreted trypsin-like serine protease